MRCQQHREQLISRCGNHGNYWLSNFYEVNTATLAPVAIILPAIYWNYNWRRCCCWILQELEMHARAHGIPTTPLTSDTTTALLSSMLTTKATSEAVKVKQEPSDSSGCSATRGRQDSQEPMESYSSPSSCTPSPRSPNMDDDMTDWAVIITTLTWRICQECLGHDFEMGRDLFSVVDLLVWARRVMGCFRSWFDKGAYQRWSIQCQTESNWHNQQASNCWKFEVFLRFVRGDGEKNLCFCSMLTDSAFTRKH